MPCLKQKIMAARWFRPGGTFGDLLALRRRSRSGFIGALSLGFHSGEKAAHLEELRASFKRLQAGIGEHLEEPGTAELV
jgi:hypothetical protein